MRRRRHYTTLRTTLVRGHSGPALVKVSIRLRLDDGAHVTAGKVNIPKRIKMPEHAFRSTVAEQLRRLADLIVGANGNDLLNPLAWPLVQFDRPSCAEELKKVSKDAART